MVALGVLAIAFVVYSQLVTLGVVDGADRAVAVWLAPYWNDWLRPLAYAVALLGGMELTTLLVVGLAVYLVRNGFRHEAWALLTFPLALLAEFVYKRLVQHPGPFEFAHGDGPSVTMLLERGPLTLTNTYPSGHMLRTVLIYGLLAFVIYRLAPPGRRKRLAVALAAVIIAIVAFDRVYLGVHWISDVVGGLLLGGLALAAAIVWLEQPRPVVK
jgi:membrane-associated phospholipid phosphatase